MRNVAALAMNTRAVYESHPDDYRALYLAMNEARSVDEFPENARELLHKALIELDQKEANRGEE